MPADKENDDVSALPVTETKPALFKQRDAALDPIVIVANDAFARIRTHRLLFERDWLPFAIGVHHLSMQAWEATGQRTRLDGTPDWTYAPTQAAFRDLIRDLPWEHFFDDNRRSLLSVLRKIGGDRKRFLAWFNELKEDVRERIGYPVTLWRMFEKEVLKLGAQPEQPDHDDECEHDEDGAEVAARTDADRMADLVAANEICRDFCLRLRASVDDGRSALEAGLREDLDHLLDGGMS
jgi:hypothetical protein